MQKNNLNVIHNTEQARFEVSLGGDIAQLNYHFDGNTIVFTHTGVPAELEGKGIGSLLVHAGLEYAKQNNLKVKAVCWFVSGYIERHVEYQELTV